MGSGERSDLAVSGQQAGLTVCARCGKTIGHGHGNRKYCPECVVPARRERRRKRENQSAQFTCPECGRTVERIHGQRKYCPECSRAVQRRQSAEHMRRKRAQNPRNPRMLVCPVCGDEFAPATSNQRYCTKDCAAAARRAYARRPAVELVCPVCGKSFVKHHGQQKYCTPECRERNEKGDFYLDMPQRVYKSPGGNQGGIAAVAAQARAAGMTYGQYVSKYGG